MAILPIDVLNTNCIYYRVWVRTLQQKAMTAYEKARNNPRQFKTLTSLSIEKFDILLPIFECKWEIFIEKYNLDGTPRLRKYVPKNEKQLPSIGDKLFFLLFYKKTRSLQEVMAFHRIGDPL